MKGKKIDIQKIDKKNIIIISLVILLICISSFTGYTYLQNIQTEQSIMIEESYNKGISDGVESTINNILNQLNTTGYVTLNINGQIIFLQPITTGE